MGVGSSEWQPNPVERNMWARSTMGLRLLRPSIRTLTQDGLAFGMSKNLDIFWNTQAYLPSLLEKEFRDPTETRLQASYTRVDEIRLAKGRIAFRYVRLPRSFKHATLEANVFS